jgi:hypothetical protein
MQTFDQDEAFAILPDEDRRLLPHLQYALGDLLRLRRFESSPPLHRYINVRNLERQALHHEVCILAYDTPQIHSAPSYCQPEGWASSLIAIFAISSSAELAPSGRSMHDHCMGVKQKI